MPDSEKAPTSHFTKKPFKLAVYAAWAGATIVAGIGAGLLYSDSRPGRLAEAPNPIATANIIAAPVASTDIAPPRAPVSQRDLPARPGSAILQAQAGMPFSTASIPVFQPGTGPGTLQPGYTNAGREQGNLGTPPAL